MTEAERMVWAAAYVTQLTMGINADDAAVGAYKAVQDFRSAQVTTHASAAAMLAEMREPSESRGPYADKCAAAPNTIANLRDVLRLVEWSAGDRGGGCAVCGNLKAYDHRGGCRLAAALREADDE